MNPFTSSTEHPQWGCHTQSNSHPTGHTDPWIYTCVLQTCMVTLSLLSISVLYAKFFTRNLNMYLHFIYISSYCCNGLGFGVHPEGRLKFSVKYMPSTEKITWDNIETVDAWIINPLRAKFFWGNINKYLHFMSLLHIALTRALKFLPSVRPGLTYST